MQQIQKPYILQESLLLSNNILNDEITCVNLQFVLDYEIPELLCKYHCQEHLATIQSCQQMLSPVTDTVCLLSLSTVALNSRDFKETIWLPKNAPQKTTLHKKLSLMCWYNFTKAKNRLKTRLEWSYRILKISKTTTFRLPACRKTHQRQAYGSKDQLTYRNTRH